MGESRAKAKRKAALLVAVAFGVVPMLIAAPASAAGTCAAGVADAANATVASSATIQMSGTAVDFGGQTCPADTTLIHVTGSGAMTFNLTPGDFVTESGESIRFELDMTGPSSVVVNGTPDGDRITLGTRGVNLDASGAVEIGAQNDDVMESGVTTWTVNGLAKSDLVSAGGEVAGSDFPLAATLNGGNGSASGTADGADFLTGGDGNDTLNGGTGNDTLNGGDGTDAILGNDGADTIANGSAADGADDIDGGAGRDRADYSRRAEAVTVTMATTPGTGDDGEATEGDDVFNVESASGGDGGDTLSAASYPATTRVTLSGGDGADSLTGGMGRDSLRGGDEDDTIDGGDGADALDGGRGDDTETGGAGNDSFDQGGADSGDDTMNGGAGTDVVNYLGRSEAITVTVGGAGADGAAGENDVVGADVERVIGSSRGDFLTASSTGSTLLGGGGDDKLTGQGGNDVLKGGAGSDTLNGDDGDDKLFGGSGEDHLQGGPGDDLLNGGSGTDSCADSGGGATRRSC